MSYIGGINMKLCANNFKDIPYSKSCGYGPICHHYHTCEPCSLTNNNYQFCGTLPW